MTSDDVQKMRNITIVMANVARSNIMVESMKTANIEQDIRGLPKKYSEMDFLNIIDGEGIGWNSVINQLNQ